MSTTADRASPDPPLSWLAISRVWNTQVDTMNG